MTLAMKMTFRRGAAVAAVLAGLVAVFAVVRAPSAAAADAASAAPSGVFAAVAVVPGMAPVIDPRNLYSETASEKFSAVVRGDLERIYVPNLRSNDVYVVDPKAMKVVDRFKVGIGPQHNVPAWD